MVISPWLPEQPTAYGESRLTTTLDNIWAAADRYAKANGYKKEHGHWQGLPAT